MKHDLATSDRFTAGDLRSLDDMRRRHFAFGDEIDPRALRERDVLLAKVPLGVWDAFLELSSSRQLGAMGGAGHIPHSEFLAWSELAGLRDPGARRAWWGLIRLMDGEYVRHMNRKDEPERGNRK